MTELRDALSQYIHTYTRSCNLTFGFFFTHDEVQEGFDVGHVPKDRSMHGYLKL